MRCLLIIEFYWFARLVGLPFETTRGHWNSTKQEVLWGLGMLGNIGGLVGHIINTFH